MSHIHSMYDFIVSVFVVCEDQILFVQHRRYDKWLPIGGHVQLDEDPEGALLREIDEETGIDAEIIGSKPEFNIDGVRSLIAPRYMNVHEAGDSHQHISLIYFAIADTKKVKLSDEHSAYKWLGIDDLSDPKYGLQESLIFYAKQALREISE